MQKNENRPGYKQTKVGWIPREWKTDLLECHSIRGSGHTPNKKEPSYYNGSITWISLADSSALDKGIIDKSRISISSEGIKHSSAVLHPKGTVLISRDAGVGKAAVAGSDLCVSQHFITWECNETTLHNWFLYRYLQYRKREFERIAIGSTIKTIGLPYFKKYQIPLPPLPEQKAIAQVLECWDKTIRAYERKFEIKRNIKKGLMQRLLSGKQRLPGFNGEWEKVRVGEVCEVLDSKRIPLNSETRKRMKGDVPYYGANGVVDFVNEYIYDEELVLVAEDGGHFDEFAHRPIAQLIRGRSWVNNHAHVLSANNGENIFLFFSLVHKNILKYLNGGTRAKLNKSELLSIGLNMPPIEEQQAISGIISSADTEISAMESKLTSLRDQKRFLLNNLVTGTIRLPQFTRSEYTEKSRNEHAS